MLDACPHHHPDEPTPTAEQALEGVSLRQPRNSRTGGRMWRSLDELAATPAFAQMLHREFPHAAAEWTDESSRRHFLKLMGASLALAGLSACTVGKTRETMVPYVVPPEEVIPGRPLFFATTSPWMGYGKGVVVESHEGRPTKIEGNRDHPSSLGACDIWTQSSVLEMYDPDRSQTVKHGNDTSSWGVFTSDMVNVMAKAKADRGAGLRFLTGTVTSPTVARLLNEILEQYPQAKWCQHEAVGRRNARMAAQDTFGRDVEPVYSFDRASVILSLDSNFLTDLPGSMAYANAFIAGRRVRDNTELKMNRLYVAEPSVTLTGARADHRLPVKGGEVEQLARDVAAAVGGAAPAAGPHAAWVKAVAADLTAAKGTGLVIAGETQPPAVHALAYLLNEQLGNVGEGKPVRYIDAVEVYAKKTGPLHLEDLLRDVNAGEVDVLVVMGTNPCFTAPANLGLRNGLNAPSPDARRGDFEKDNPLHKVGLIVHHGLYGAEVDETAAFASWHVPANHYLESWGDLRGHDGTASPMQPLIEPLYSTKSDVELLAFLAGQGSTSAYELVKATWEAKYKVVAAHATDPFETYWEKSVEKGVFLGSAYQSQTVKAHGTLADRVQQPASTRPSSNGIEICFRPDPSVWDGRFSNLAWLQELPKPVSLLTWDTAAFMSLATARRLKVENADQGRGLETKIVKVTYQGRDLAVPALIMPGHADDSITIYHGYGRIRGGRVTQAASGSDAYYIRPTDGVWSASGADVQVQDDSYLLATAQSHHLIDIPAKDPAHPNDPDAGKSRLDEYWLKERDLIHTYQLSELTGRPAAAAGYRKVSLKINTDHIPHHEAVDPAETLLPAWKYEYNKWGMVIDNQACIGCNACVTACQSENNIAVVGKEQVLKGRIMLWLRIDTYFDGESHGSPNVYFQPIPCMHCENAPCTLVCPVEATTISAEGLNEMTYNRCVGTRYCSNNCPYKVRRFNFMQWTDYETPQFMLQRNPNVTVRSRGVMEKCNYCVQRINNGRIEAKKLDRPIDPGEVVTACAQACPTQAIAFGNLNDPRWEVTKLQAEPLRYTILDELNTLPRTSYLPRVSNPSPLLPTDVGRTGYEGPAENEPAAEAQPVG